MKGNKMSFNLPPGVTENMIPGNRPEDLEWESLFDWMDTIDMDVDEFVTAIISYCMSHDIQFDKDHPILKSHMVGSKEK
jgi:hypothetical protein